MKKFWQILLTSGFLLFLIAGAGFFYWRKGTPYREPYWSPNNQFYVQRYSNWTPSSLYPAMPGQSGAADGYVRLHDKNGKLIREEFVNGIEYLNEPYWKGNKVYIWMIAENDPWILPGSSE